VCPAGAQGGGDTKKIQNKGPNEPPPLFAPQPAVGRRPFISVTQRKSSARTTNRRVRVDTHNMQLQTTPRFERIRRKLYELPPWRRRLFFPEFTAEVRRKHIRTTHNSAFAPLANQLAVSCPPSEDGDTAHSSKLSAHQGSWKREQFPFALGSWKREQSPFAILAGCAKITKPQNSDFFIHATSSCASGFDENPAPNQTPARADGSNADVLTSKRSKIRRLSPSAECCFNSTHRVASKLTGHKYTSSTSYYHFLPKGIELREHHPTSPEPPFTYTNIANIRQFAEEVNSSSCCQ